MRTNGAPASITVSRGQNAAEFIPKTLYVANAGDGSISAFPVSATNGVPNPPNSYLSNGNSTAVITDSLGKYLYAANWWDNRISGFSINPTTSVLTSIDTSPYDSGVTPSGLWFEPTGQYLYTTSWDQLVMMSFDHETGTLENVHSVTATGSVQGLASGGGGRYLYVLGSGSIAGFNISPYGSPTAVPWAPIKLDVPVMGSYARAITVDPTGNFLYVAITGYGNDSTDLQAFSINQMTGALTVIPGSPFTAGRNPISLATDAWGRYLYAGSYDGVQAFRINHLTGALTSIATYPLSGAYVLSLWADPSGRYLYAGAGGTDELRAYHIDSASGALTEVTGSPFSGVNNPWAITGTVSVK